MSTIFEKVAGCEPLLSACGLDSMDALFQWDKGQRLDKPGLEPWRQRWRAALSLPGGEPVTFYLKRFRSPPLRRQFARWLHGNWFLSTAGVEWRNARELTRAGVPVAESAAFGQEMAGPWEQRSFILIREVAGLSLERWLPVHLPPPAQETDLARRRNLLEGLALFVGGFHRAGFVHRDLYLSHIFIQPLTDPFGSVRGRSGLGGANGGAGGPHDEFRLIDLQRVFRPRWRRRRWVVKDLAALHYSTPADRVSLAERLRFLCRYVRACGQLGTARQLAEAVGAKASRIAAHERARRRETPGVGGGKI
jgi:hypothetical protein